MARGWGATAQIGGKRTDALGKHDVAPKVLPRRAELEVLMAHVCGEDNLLQVPDDDAGLKLQQIEELGHLP